MQRRVVGVTLVLLAALLALVGLPFSSFSASAQQPGSPETIASVMASDSNLFAFADLLTEGAGEDFIRQLYDPEERFTVFAVGADGANIVGEEPATLVRPFCPGGALGDPGSCYELVPFGPFGNPTCETGILEENLCVIVGEPPVVGPSFCPTIPNNVYWDGTDCYSVLARPVIDGVLWPCPTNSTEVDGDCRRAVALREGPLECVDPLFTLTEDDECLRWITPVTGPTSCPEGAELLDGQDQCRLPVDTDLGGFVCEAPKEISPDNQRVCQTLADRLPLSELGQIVRYHIVDGAFDLDELVTLGAVTTRQGSTLTIEQRGDQVFVNDTPITSSTSASNGVVHVIDQLLIPDPDSFPPEARDTLADVIASTPNLSFFGAAVELVATSGEPAFAEQLAGITGGGTVLAPTNRAFALMDQAALADAINDPTGELLRLVANHVVSGFQSGEALAEAGSVTTFAGADAVVEARDGTLYIDDVLVSVTDIGAINGVLHVIDAVRVPAPAPEPTPTPEPTPEPTPGPLPYAYFSTLAEQLAETPGITSFVSAMVSTAEAGGPDLLARFADPSERFTVFAVSNGEFDALTTLSAADGYCPAGFGRHPYFGAMCTKVGPALRGEASCPDGALGERDACYIDVALARDPETGETTCPNGALRVLDRNECRQPVANKAGSYYCEHPAAGLNGKECVIFTGLVVEASTDALVDVVTYHVVPEALYPQDLVEAGSITTLQGSDLVIEDADGVSDILVNGVPTKASSYYAGNGLLYFVDELLIPELDDSTPLAPVDPATSTIADIALADPDLRFLTSALGLASAKGDTDFMALAADADADITLFAPTNRAFAALDQTLLGETIGDPAGRLTGLLQGHVLDSSKRTNELVVGSFATLYGNRLSTTTGDGGLVIGNARLTVTDIEAVNGVIHIVDAVLAPEALAALPQPGDELPSIADIIAENPDLTRLGRALDYRLEPLLADRSMDFTLFAPTDAAFAMLDSGALEPMVCPEGFAADSSLSGQCANFEPATQDEPTCPRGARVDDAGCYVREDRDFDTILCRYGDLDDQGACLVTGHAPVVVADMTFCRDASFTVLANWCYRLDETVEGPPRCKAGATPLPATDLCRRPVDAQPGAYFCEDPAAALSGKVCIYIVDMISNDGARANDVVVRNHLLGSSLELAELVAAGSAQTVLPSEVVIEVRDGQAFVDDSRLVVVDIPAANGVVHIIDRVLIPEEPSAADPVLTDLLEERPQLSSFVRVLKTASASGPSDYWAALSSPGEYTVFAPTNKALAELGDALEDICPAGFTKQALPLSECEQVTAATALAPACPPGVSGTPGSCFVRVPFEPTAAICADGIPRNGLCLVEGDWPVSSGGTCVVSSTVFLDDDFCYQLVPPVPSCTVPYELDGDTCRFFNSEPADLEANAAFVCPDVEDRTVSLVVRSIGDVLTIAACTHPAVGETPVCPGGAVPYPDGCRRPAVIRPGPRVCLEPGFSLLDGRCFRLVPPVPGPPVCPADSVKVPDSNECRLSVADRVGYTCQEAGAVLVDASCVITVDAVTQDPTEVFAALIEDHLLSRRWERSSGFLDLVTVSGTVLKVRTTWSGGIFVNDVPVDFWAIEATNGVLRIVDSVLVVPVPDCPDGEYRWTDGLCYPFPASPG